MKKLLFAFLLTAPVMLAQATGGSPGKAAETGAGKPSTTSNGKIRSHARASGKKALEKNEKDKGGKKGAQKSTTAAPKQ
jgi:hypothetical protein